MTVLLTQDKEAILEALLSRGTCVTPDNATGKEYLCRLVASGELRPGVPADPAQEPGPEDAHTRSGGRSGAPTRPGPAVPASPASVVTAPPGATAAGSAPAPVYDLSSDESDHDGRKSPFANTRSRHGASDDEDCPSDPEELVERTKKLEARLRHMRRSFGPEDERTLDTVFKLLDALVAQYRLNRMDELFAEYFSVCEKVRGKWYLKAIQSKAFCCFKQYRFREALRLFQEQERLMGPSGPLCENIGHVCSSLGDYEAAERYFVQATKLLPSGVQHAKNSGGVYLGLGLLRDRLGRSRDALPVLYQSLDMYRDSCYATGKYVESSLVAKAHMSVGHAHEHLGELDKAEEHMREAVAVFERTVGEDSPLLASALGALGKVRIARGSLDDGSKHLRRSLDLEVRKDAFHLRTVWELLEDVKVVHDTELKSRTSYSAADLASVYSCYIPAVRTCLRRMDELEKDKEEPDTAAVLRKTCGELLLLAGEDEPAIEALSAAIRMFKGFTEQDCSSLIESCQTMIGIGVNRLSGASSRARPAQQRNPPKAAADTARMAGHRGQEGKAGSPRLGGGAHHGLRFQDVSDDHEDADVEDA